MPQKLYNDWITGCCDSWW